ncbi:MAG: hypothetical protein OXC62_02830 [Aestuariivita sp.]|nr:hypothetical protein [Aestuariivita sp.]
MLKKATPNTPGAFPVFMSKSMSAQRFIRGEPDGYLVSIKIEKPDNFLDKDDSSSKNCKPRVLKHAAHLLVTAGQDSASARLTAIACEKRYLGSGGWLPVPDFNFKESKALAVFLNSTAGRIQLMRQAGKKLSFPTYNPAAWLPIRGPDIKDPSTLETLGDCWERTADIEVPQFREGEGNGVRALWDNAVANVMDWDPNWLAELRLLLHDEPHVKALGREDFMEEDD